MSRERSTSRSISSGRLLLYAGGSLGVALTLRATSTYGQFLYVDILGVPAAWIGAAWLVYGIWNAANDVIAGYLSDRTRTRWGRRTPWIVAFFIPLSVVFYLIWFPFGADAGPRSDVGLLTYFLALMMIFDLLWTLVVTNWSSLFPEMVTDSHHRVRVLAVRHVFTIIGLLIGVALPPLLAGQDWADRGPMAILLAAVTAVSFGISILGIREQDALAREPMMPFREALRLTLDNRNFIYLLGLTLLVQYTFLAVSTTIPFYAKYVLAIREPVTAGSLMLSPELQTSVLLAVPFLVTLVCIPLWGLVARRFGAWWALSACLLLTAGILLTFFVPDSFPGGVAVLAAFGVGLAGLMMLAELLLADLVDADEIVTGVRREGMYYGMNGTVGRLAFVIQGVVSGIVLTATNYVNLGPADPLLLQPDSALFGIRLMIGGLPALALLLGFLLLRNYTLRGRELTRMRVELGELQSRRAADPVSVDSVHGRADRGREPVGLL